MAEAKISRKLIREITEKLSQGKRVREALLDSGRLHIDRTLPFLIVYRRPDNCPDPGMDRLIKGEASYLIAPSPHISGSGILNLIMQITKVLSDEYGACLIIDVWSAIPQEPSNTLEMVVPRPSFKISIPKYRPPTEAIEALESSLKRIKILKRSAVVELVPEIEIGADLRAPVMSEATARKMNCFILGLEIDPFYRDPQTHEVFPLVLSRLHRSLSVAFKKSAFEFARNRTTRKLVSYQALGRRAFVKSVWDTDKKLADISQSFDFLLQVTPVNTEKAWRAFKKSHFEKVPIFYYRPQPIDPALVKRKLYQIPIERVDDATLGFLFREKRKELDRQLGLLQDRGKPEFYYGGLQLYGAVADQLADTAREILNRFSDYSNKKDGGRKVLNAIIIAERARGEIEYYRQMYPEMASQVQIRDDILGLLVSQGNLLIARDIKIPEARVEAMLSHEVGTHVLTYYNGKAQPFQQLYCGFAGYDELQEGLAVLSEYLVGQLSPQRLRLLAGRVLAAHKMQCGATFLEVFHELNSVYGFEQKTAFIITTRIYRGGGLIKDAIYLRGLVNLLEYLKDGGDTDILFCGKIALDHVPIIQELQAREILCTSPLVPRYMKSADVDRKLATLREGLEVYDLVTWR
ncbi:MAG: DUF1704 domain-containing protein [Planctomycetes bacterium]|nr:DUF1704 domain-containing protein [Planctomycetota bacterium]